ncbi:MAG: hypothetical protein M1530_03875 [Candidatus Marsarchaeota archaeon]|nr:hypothetical protein [Candidatus Marsarchaeota archaeon]
MTGFKTAQDSLIKLPPHLVTRRIFAGLITPDMKKSNPADAEIISYNRERAALFSNQLQNDQMSVLDAQNRLCSICVQVMLAQKRLGVVVRDEVAEAVLRDHFRSKRAPGPSELYGNFIIKNPMRTDTAWAEGMEVSIPYSLDYAAPKVRSKLVEIEE